MMPWQQYMADVVGEVDDDGMLVYGESDSTVPRQSGKTVWLLAEEVTRCQRPDQWVLYLAQNQKAARAKLVNDHMKRLDRSPFKARCMYHNRYSNGSEAVEWVNGSRMIIDAVSDTAGHGATLHMTVVDEAFAHEDDVAEQAAAPAMLTVPDAQLLVNSTAGNARSKYLYRKVLAGRKGDTQGVAYFEWSAPEDADPGDPRVWRMCMPALGYTVTEAKIEAEWRRAQRGGQEGIDLFKRAYLNIWVDPPVLDEELEWVIPKAAWLSCRDYGSDLVRVSVYAVDVSPDRSWASVAMAGPRADGLTHVEVVDRRPGTDWVVGRVEELLAADGAGLVLDPAGPAGSLVAELPQARLVTAREQAQWCGLFYDAVVTRQVFHAGQPVLDAALAGAARRSLSDAWAWSRSKSSVDISSLVAVTMAHGVAARPVDPVLAVG